MLASFEESVKVFVDPATTDGDRDAAFDIIINGLSGDPGLLTSLLELMGPSLLSKDPRSRRLSVGLVSRVCRSPRRRLTSSSHALLVTFLCGRLVHDPPAAAESFSALWGLLGGGARFRLSNGGGDDQGQDADGDMDGKVDGEGEDGWFGVGAGASGAEDAASAIACGRGSVVELLGVLCLDQGVSVQALPVSARMWGLALLHRIIRLCAREVVEAEAAVATHGGAMEIDDAGGDTPGVAAADPSKATFAARYGMDLAFTVLRAIDGEKDPRCLAVAFQLVEATVATVSEARTRFAEEFFEVTACYFPVAFSPPPGGFPTGPGAPPEVPPRITRENLAGLLERALASHPCMAQHVYPIVAEKLAADGDTARADALSLLGYTVAGFGAQTVARHARSAVWPAVRDVVVHGGGDAEIKQTALRVLAKVARALENEDPPVQGERPLPVFAPHFAQPGTLLGYLTDLSASHCAHVLVHPATTAARGCAALAAAMCTAGPATAAAVCDRVVPVLVKTVAETASKKQCGSVPCGSSPADSAGHGEHDHGSHGGHGHSHAPGETCSSSSASSSSSNSSGDSVRLAAIDALSSVVAAASGSSWPKGGHHSQRNGSAAHPLERHVSAVYDALMVPFSECYAPGLASRQRSAARAVSLLAMAADSNGRWVLADDLASSAASRIVAAAVAEAARRDAEAAGAAIVQTEGDDAGEPPHVAMASAALRIASGRPCAADTYQPLLDVIPTVTPSPGASPSAFLPGHSGVAIAAAVSSSGIDAASAGCVRRLSASVASAWSAGAVAESEDAVRCLRGCAGSSSNGNLTSATAGASASSTSTEGSILRDEASATAGVERGSGGSGSASAMIAGPELSAALLECFPRVMDGLVQVVALGSAGGAGASAICASACGFLRTGTAALGEEGQLRAAREACEWAGLPYAGQGDAQAPAGDADRVAIACAVLSALFPAVAAQVVPHAPSTVAAAVAPGAARDQALSAIANFAAKAAAPGKSAQGLTKNDTFANAVLDCVERGVDGASPGDISLCVGAVARGLVGAGGAAWRLPAMQRSIESLFSLLDSGAYAGFGMATMQDDDGMFGKATHAKSMPVSRQRFYTEQVARLLADHGPGTPAPPVPILGAVTSMLVGLPSDILTADLPRLLPVLVHTLCSISSSSDTTGGSGGSGSSDMAIAGVNNASDTVQLGTSDVPRFESALTIVLGTARTDASKLSSYVDELVASLRRLAVSKGSVRVRVMAVESLHALAGLRPHLIAPHARGILATMKAAVADRKRVVRQAAAACANRYSMI